MLFFACSADFLFRESGLGFSAVFDLVLAAIVRWHYAGWSRAKYWRLVSYWWAYLFRLLSRLLFFWWPLEEVSWTRYLVEWCVQCVKVVMPLIEQTIPVLKNLHFELCRFCFSVTILMWLPSQLPGGIGLSPHALPIDLPLFTPWRLKDFLWHYVIQIPTEAFVVDKPLYNRRTECLYREWSVLVNCRWPIHLGWATRKAAVPCLEASGTISTVYCILFIMYTGIPTYRSSWWVSYVDVRRGNV